MEKIFCDLTVSEKELLKKIVISNKGIKHVAVMPDAHWAQTCMVGFTARFEKNGYINPNIIGPDLGCGVSVFKIKGFEKKEFDFQEITDILNKICDYSLKNKKRLMENIQHNPFPFLGGGNHFFEIDSCEDEHYIVIHSGSFVVGGYKYKSLQDQIKNGGTKTECKNKKEKIAELKMMYAGKQLEEKIKEISKIKLETDLMNIEEYFEEIIPIVKFASRNREMLAREIANQMGWEIEPLVESIHNYVTFNQISNDLILRKGAIEAVPGKMVVIPLNMKDGCVIGEVTENTDLLEEWNYSLPHGAGRKMSRTEAKKQIDIEKFKASMQDIIVGNKCENCIDEAPDSYKDPNMILEKIKDSLKEIKVTKPIYNFKM